MMRIYCEVLTNVPYCVTGTGKWCRIKPITDFERKVPMVINLMRDMLQENIPRWSRMKNHMYIGRKNPAHKLRESKWHNPYRVKQYGRGPALQMYEEYMREKIKSDPINYDLRELGGKIMGCVCAPLECHGDVLRNLYIEEFKPKKIEAGPESSSENETEDTEEENQPTAREEPKTLQERLMKTT